MLATQFSEKQWSQIVSPVIAATLNAAGMVMNLAQTVFYRPALYQGIDAKNTFLLQEITHIMAFLNESICGSSTGNLLHSIAEAFWVEMGIPFPITGTEYDEKTSAYYMPDDWYKLLWKFTLKACYKIGLFTKHIFNICITPNSMDTIPSHNFRNCIA